MPNRVFRNTDASAPAITNTLGDFTSLLDKVLVTGYPTQSITSITQTAGLATATKVGHGYATGNVISQSGAAQDGYNGNKTITVTDADHYTFPVAGGTVSPATGTLLASNGKTGLGWELVFTGTNKRVYRPRSGSRMYLRVAHDRLTYMADVRGFEAMTTVDAGTGPFPTDAQQAAAAVGSLRWQTQNNVAGTRGWFAWGNDTQFLFQSESDSSAPPGRTAGYFGDIVSYKTGDAYNCLLIGKEADTTTVQNSENWNNLSVNALNGITTRAGHYMPRAASQTGSAILAGKFSDNGRHSNVVFGGGTPGTNTLVYPAPIDGGLHVARIFVANGVGVTGGPRGYIAGIWNMCHDLNSMVGVAHADQFTASDGVNSFTGEIRQCTNSGGSAAFVVEL